MFRKNVLPFDFVKSYNNDMFSKMENSDVKELLSYINSYYLDLRDKLELDINITFGVEIEFENARMSEIRKEFYELYYNYGWELVRDSSLIFGGEIISPILSDKKNVWKILKMFCEFISKYGSVGSKTGAHVHVGSHIFECTEDAWLNFIKLWSVYENVIYRFSYGEYLSHRDSIDIYASPCSKLLWDRYEELIMNGFDLYSIPSSIPSNKYNAVSFAYVLNEGFKEGNTVEFRCANGTLNPVVWQNNINFFVSLMLYAKSRKFDDDLVTERHLLLGNKKRKLDDYNDIFIEQALELSDMIFDNNLDKVYFLRQYIKDYGRGIKPLQKAKKFTR